MAALRLITFLRKKERGLKDGSGYNITVTKT